jgi:hypothetical protein
VSWHPLPSLKVRWRLKEGALGERGAPPTYFLIYHGFLKEGGRNFPRGSDVWKW